MLPPLFTRNPHHSTIYVEDLSLRYLKGFKGDLTGRLHEEGKNIDFPRKIVTRMF